MDPVLDTQLHLTHFTMLNPFHGCYPPIGMENWPSCKVGNRRQNEAPLFVLCLLSMADVHVCSLGVSAKCALFEIWISDAFNGGLLAGLGVCVCVWL